MDFYKKKIAKKGLSGLEQKRYITIEFSTFESEQVPSFSLRKQLFFSFFGLDLLRQGISGLKKKKT